MVRLPFLARFQHFKADAPSQSKVSTCTTPPRRCCSLASFCQAVCQDCGRFWMEMSTRHLKLQSVSATLTGHGFECALDFGMRFARAPGESALAASFMNCLVADVQMVCFTQMVFWSPPLAQARESPFKSVAVRTTVQH